MSIKRFCAWYFLTPSPFICPPSPPCSSHTGLLTVGQTCQICSCLRASAWAVPSTWNSLNSDPCVDHSLIFINLKKIVFKINKLRLKDSVFYKVTQQLKGWPELAGSAASSWALAPQPCPCYTWSHTSPHPTPTGSAQVRTADLSTPLLRSLQGLSRPLQKKARILILASGLTEGS